MKPLNLNTFILARLMLVVFVCFGLVSCEGPEGPTGNPGATGPQGAIGPSGPTGSQGAQGPVGIANVIYSPWINSSWVRLETNAVEHIIDNSIFTEDVQSNNMVLVYMKDTPTSMAVQELPRLVYSENLIIFSLTFTLHVGFIRVVHSKSQHPDLIGADNLFPNAQVRYIIVPAEIFGRISMPDFSNYEEVCYHFGIEL